MGWIRRSDLRAFERQYLPEPVISNKQEAEVEHVEVIIDEVAYNLPAPAVVESLDDEIFPILSTKTSEKKLPFIAPSEITKRDGNGSNRLCTYQDYLPRPS